MKRVLSLLAAALLAAPAAAATEPAYVEAHLDSEGVFHSGAGNGGRTGARYQAGSTSKFACSLLALDLGHADPSAGCI